MSQERTISDEALDAQLRAAPVPPGLCARLRSIINLPSDSDDDANDDARCNIAANPSAIANHKAVAVDSRSDFIVAERDGADLLNDMLRDVAVPAEFLAKLRCAIPPSASPPSTSPLHTASEAMPVLARSELLARSALGNGSPAANVLTDTLADALIDSRLREIAVPVVLSERLKHIVVRQRATPFGGAQVRPWLRLAATAALVLLSSIAYFVMVASGIAAARFNAQLRPSDPLSDDALTLVDGAETEHPLLLETELDVPLLPSSLVADDDQPGISSTVSLLPADEPRPQALLPDPSDRPEQFARLVWKYSNRKVSWSRFAGESFDERDELPELQRRPSGISQGIRPPSWNGFDWRFYLKFDEWPVIWFNGQADNRLAVSRVPLHVGDDSFELTRRYLQEGELPPPKQIRKEEFLAAMDYQFPPPEYDALGLRTAAGPSQFGEPGTFLLQVGVQAADVPPNSRKPTRMVIAVDVSSSMTWGGRLAMIQRALETALDGLQAGDRVSLVTFNDEAQVVYEGATREDLGQVLAAVRSLSAEGGTDLVGGLRSAYATFQPWFVQWVSTAKNSTPPEPRPHVRRQVVLLTDGGGLTESGVEALSAMVAANHARDDIQLTVVDLDVSQSSKPALQRLAKTAGGRVVLAATTDDIRAAIEESLTGQSHVLAHDVQLEVTFNPMYVEAVRLIGHEAPLLAQAATARAMPGEASRQGAANQGAAGRGAAGRGAGDRGTGDRGAASPGVLGTTFVARQTATALYELKLRGVVFDRHGGPDLLRDSVATARLTWKSPDGSQQSTTQRISQLQFAGTLAETPLPLQLAALAAEAAEVLGESRYAQGSSVRRVLETARRMNEQVRQQPSYQQIVTVLESALQRGAPGRQGDQRPGSQRPEDQRPVPRDAGRGARQSDMAP